jgi:hypothetical protein
VVRCLSIGSKQKAQVPYPVAREESVAGSGRTAMVLHPVAKGVETVAFPMPIPIPCNVGFRRCSWERGYNEATSANVETVVHSNTTSLGTLSFPSARRRVWDPVALASQFEICCLAQLLGRLITNE